jgi:hypothetical protein
MTIYSLTFRRNYAPPANTVEIPELIQPIDTEVEGVPRPTYQAYLDADGNLPLLPIELAFKQSTPDYSRAGYTLIGWSLTENGDVIDLFTPIGGTTEYELFAQWAPAFYDSADPTVQAEENRLVNKALTKFPIPHISGLKLEADIRLENLILNTIDDDGVVWVCTDIDGWWDFPEPQLPDLVRGWGDGSYDAKGRWNSRIITLKGTFLTQDPSQVPAARAKLIEAANLVYRGGLLVVNEEPAKSAFVRLSGSPDIKTVTARGRTEFSIGLRAADPIKYEYFEDSVNDDGYRTRVFTPSSGAANATLTNLGNIDVPILIELSQGFTVSNPATPPKIRNNDTDQEISIIGGTVSTNRLEIDTYNREVLDVRYQSGQVAEVSSGRSKVSTLSDWIYLAPGQNSIILSNFPSGSSCTIYYRSGWIG